MDSIDNIIISFFIKPNIIVNNILELTSDELDYLKTFGIKGLILDVDETLRYNMKMIDNDTFNWALYENGFNGTNLVKNKSVSVDSNDKIVVYCHEDYARELLAKYISNNNENVPTAKDMIPGRLTHVIADAHIYDRHREMIESMIRRPMYPAPKVSLDPSIKDFYKFTTDSLIVENYQAGEQIKNIPVAV